MKKTNYILAFIFSWVAVAGAFAGIWENYSNITSITDAVPSGDHLWITAKGGVIDMNTTSGERRFFQRGDAGLPSSSVEQIAINSADNVVWVGTYDAGVVSWDGSIWTTYPFPDVFNLYRMKIDGFGNLWIQANTGLFKFNTTTHEYTFVNTLAGAGWDFDAWDFDITPENHVLIFTGTNCVVIDAATNAAIDSFPNSESAVVISCTPTTVRTYEVNDLCYLISNFGQLEFEFKDGSFETATTGLPEFAYINNIERGADNELYVFVNGNAIYKLTGLEWEFVKTLDANLYDQLIYANESNFYVDESTYNTTPDLFHITNVLTEAISLQEFNFPSNVIGGIVKNPDGGIWMASGSEIYTYNNVSNNWDLYSAVPTVYGSMYDLQYADGKLYGIDYGNLIEYFDGTTWMHIPYADGYTSVYVFDYDVSSDGVIYFVNDDGLFKSEDGITEILIATPSVFDWFLSVKYDAARNLVWLGNIDGIIKYDFDSQELINSIDVPAMSAGTSIQEISIDENNNVWFGANNNKAYKYDGLDWEDFTVGTGNEFIIEFAFDGAKTYFGLTGDIGGISVYDSYLYTWESYSSAEDIMMASNSVNQLAIDANHDLWVAHNDTGASVYRLAEEPEAIVTNQNENSILIYPNPASEFIQVNELPAHYFATVTDLQGKIIIKGNLVNNSLSINNLISGIYLLNIYDLDKGTFTSNEFNVQH